MAPKYPLVIPTATDYPDRTDDVDWIYAARYNEIKKEVLAICVELGVSPSGASATLVARLALLALKSNVLELDNTTPFTPDADHEPATKKYVDENAAGASLALDNLVSVAINESLIPDTNNTDDLGSDAKKWKDGYFSGALKVLGDVYTVPRTAYHDSSTIVGFVSYTVKTLNYKKIGKTVFVTYNLAGTSNNIATSFTLPFTSAAAPAVDGNVSLGYAKDNGTVINTAVGYIEGSTNIYKMFPATVGGNWTATGLKHIRGQFFYETA